MIRSRAALDRVAEGRWIAGTVGQENAGGFAGEGFLLRTSSQEPPSCENLVGAAAAQDVVFHPVIVGDDGDGAVRRRQGAIAGEIVCAGNQLKTLR